MENETEQRLLESQAEKDTGLLGRIWEENKLIWRIALPAILFSLAMFGVFVVTQSFLGHISKVELAAYALVQAIFFRFTNGILIGMSSATQTLCGQAFGAKQYHMLGIYLQRSWIVNSAVATIILPLFIFASPILKLLQQEDDVADASEQISLWFTGVVYSMVFTLTTEMFLQAQRKNMLIGIVSPLSFVLHVFLSWIFVSKLDWGVSGAMGALVVSRWAFSALMACYTFGGWCSDTWTGFSREALHDIIPIVKLSLSSGVMICVQLWYNSVLVLLAGYTSNATVNISAFSISMNINTWQYMFCLGFFGSTCARVANELGNGDAKAAKFTIKITLTFAMSIGFIMALICLVFGREIPYLFTSDDEVAELAGDFSVPLALAILLNSLETVLSGVAVGTGSQAKVALINVGSYYFVGVPIGCVLTFVANYGVMVDKATNRLNRFYLESNTDQARTS